MSCIGGPPLSGRVSGCSTTVDNDGNVVTTLNIAFLSGDTSCETITLVLNDGTSITASEGVLQL
ncbi:MAG: hypothetical protein M3O70_26310 [Actinomycetota bacterium]|nr:hypothetical protein [Actinomycetota bacterium]